MRGAPFVLHAINKTSQIFVCLLSNSESSARRFASIATRYSHLQIPLFHKEAIPMRLPTALDLVSALALAVAAASAVADDQHGRDSDDSHHVHTATPIS